MSRPLFVVVTPALDAEQHLDACLASVADQGVEVEHILADGGSTDQTVAMARAAGCQVIEGPDRGLYDGLQKALAVATGRWWVHLNADDVLPPGALQAIAAAASDDVDVVQGLADLFADGDPATSLRTYRQGSRGLDPRDATLGNPVVNARVIRTDVLREIGGYDPAFRVAGDREMLVRLTARGARVQSVEDVIYRYRQHAGSLTFGVEREPDAFLEEHLRIADKHADVGDAELQECLRVWRAREVGRLIRRSWVAPPRAVRLLAEALRRDPALMATVRALRQGACTPASW